MNLPINTIPWRVGILLMLCFWGQALSAQEQDGTEVLRTDVIPPSPAAAAIARYGELPPNHFTGAVNVSLPLFSLQSKQLSVPVSLGYTSQGCKVDEIASWVGDGWALMAGGLISRTLYNKADERQGVGYWQIGDSMPDPNINRAAFGGWHPPDSIKRIMADGFWDTQPDVFSYNFLGYSGKFFIAPNGEVQGMPVTDLKIEYDPQPNPNMNWFRITSPDGTVFSFEDTEVTSSFSECYSAGSPTPSSHVYTSSWYLSQVITADRQDTITFDYSGDVITYPIQWTETDFYFVNSSVCSYKPKVICNTTATASIRVLREIKTRKEKALFFASDQRPDLPDGKRLDSIQVFKNGHLARSYHLGYGHFSKGGISAGAFLNLPSSAGRLRLDSVYEASAQGIHQPAWHFSYDSLPLPPLGSTAKDHWGFYNGKRNGNTLLPKTVKPNGRTWFGADRSPNPAYARAGILEQVRYPTGGSVSFTYEAHDFGLQAEVVGGLRLKAQRIHDGQDPSRDIIKRYDYRSPTNPQASTGRIFTKPRYTFGIKQLEIEYHGSQGGQGLPFVRETCHYTARTSNPGNAMFYAKGSHICYPTVTEIHGAAGEGGKTIFNYTSASDAGLVGFPYPPVTSYDHRRGMLRSKRTYDASGNLLQRQTNHFTDSLVHIAGGISCSYKTNHPNNGPGYDEFYWEKYELMSEWRKLTATTIEQFAPGGSQPFARTTRYYYDSPHHHQATRIERELGPGGVQVVKNKFLADYAPGLSLGPGVTVSDLLAQHQIGAVVEKQVWEGPSLQNLSLTSGKVSSFADYADPGSSFKVIRPERIYLLETEQPIPEASFRSREHFDGQAHTYGVAVPDFTADGLTNDYRERARFAYNAQANLISQQLTGGVLSSYLWDESGLLPIARVNNARPDEIAYTSFETDAASDGGFTFIWPTGGNIGFSSSHALTGKRSLAMSGRRVEWTAPFSGAYELSFWTKQASISVSPSGQEDPVQVGGDGWQRRRTVVSLNAGQVLQISGHGYLDEVRVMPADAQFEASLDYDEKLRISEQAGADGQPQHFRYDGLDRLRFRLDNLGNYRQSYEYHYPQR
jgi:hypothetical protein